MKILQNVCAYEHSYAVLCGKTINQTMTETLQLGQLSKTCVINQANYIFITVQQKNHKQNKIQLKKQNKKKNNILLMQFICSL